MRRLLSLALSLFLAVPTASAEEEEELPGLLLAPSFMAYKVHYPIAGARKTLLVPAEVSTTSSVTILTEENWDTRGLTWAELLPSALERAEAIATDVEIKWFRDDREVILYAMILSDNPWLSSIIFTEALRERITDKLGEEVHAIVPERNSVFLFPKHGGRLADYVAALEEIYEDSREPVSLEILEISAEGVAVTGLIGGE